MAISEFDIITKYFKREELSSQLTDVTGIGDDCSLIDIPEDMQLSQSLDTLVEGIHFPQSCDPELLGYRALAVSISDLAAMGSTPHSFILGLTLPAADESWLKGFSDGLSSIARKTGIALIGGDITRGPLTISIQVQGLIKKGKALRRNTAQHGDKIYVSGSLGDAAGALDFVLKKLQPFTAIDTNIKKLLNRYYKPSPRISLGQWLSENGATSATDISDGLIGDLSHILTTSHVGARLNLNSLPCSNALTTIYGAQQAGRFAMTGGDDYELCFTWPQNKILILPSNIDCPVSHIGNITQAPLLLNESTGEEIHLDSYRHF